GQAPAGYVGAMRHRWLIDVVTGGLGGALAAVIVVVNLVIFTGTGRGYETTIPDLMDENPFLGVIVLCILAAGPILGVWVMRRRRRTGQTT
ncbi:MAG: hypothetical protein L0Z63_08025, partial [Actinobacteria bacterium]|nr:hypothetical protein [Actinomycetota bacterium]